MIDGVEGTAQVELDQDTRMPTTVHVVNCSVVNVDHGGFSRMVCVARRLTRWQQIVRFHLLIEAYRHHSFDGLRLESQVGDRSVVVQVVGIQCGLFQPRSDDGMHLARWQHTVDERRDAGARYCARQHWAQSLDEPSWRRIRRTLLVWRRAHDDLQDLEWCGWPEDINSLRRTWLDHGRRRVLHSVMDGVDLILEVICEIIFCMFGCGRWWAWLQ